MAKEISAKELREMMLEILHNQKTMEKEIQQLRDNLKAQNALSREMLKVHRMQRDLAEKNSKQLENISDFLEKASLAKKE